MKNKGGEARYTYFLILIHLTYAVLACLHYLCFSLSHLHIRMHNLNPTIGNKDTAATDYYPDIYRNPGSCSCLDYV